MAKQPPLDPEDLKDGGRDEATEDANGNKKKVPPHKKKGLPPWLQAGRKANPKVSALQARLKK